MNRKFKKINFYLILSALAFILFFPNSSFAQDEITLQAWSSCINSVAQINLSWNSISGNPDYHILRKMEGEATTTIDIIQDISYIDAPVLSDKNYNYQIKAVRNGEEFFSNEILVPAAYCPPTLNSPTTACQSDGPRIHLSWNPVSGDVLTYNIYRATSTNGGDPFLLASTSSTSYSDGPNIAGTTEYDYFIEVVWLDSYSTTSPGIVSPTAPACPPTLNVNTNCETSTAPGGPQVDLSWNELLGVQNYQIYRKALAETEYSLLETLTGTFYTDKLVESLPDDYDQSGTISYKVIAVFPGEPKESIEQITIPQCEPFLTAESNCQEFSMRLSWTATLGAIRYNVYRAPTTSGEFTYIIGSQTEDTSYTDYLNEESCPGEICDFTYKVKASISGGELYSNEVWKDIDCFNVVPPSPPPNLEGAMAYCEGTPLDSKISISWQKSDNVHYYTVNRNGEDIDSTIEISYVDDDVEDGYEYTYQITAVGEEGVTTDSENSTTVTAINCIPPSAPELTLTEGCDEGEPYIDLSWTETSNTYSYEIYRGTTTDNLSILITLDETIHSWRDTSIFLSTFYYYKVVASGPPGVPSTDSDVKSITTSDCFPTTPALILSNSCSDQSPVVNLSWFTNEANTQRYEIFRKDYSETEPIHTIYDVTVKTWDDTSVSPETLYEYKVEAVGYFSQRATEGYKSITSWYCQFPGDFTLSGPTVYCRGSYPFPGPYSWADLSWTDSENAVSYDLNRYLYDNGSMVETTTLSDVSSPFTDRGFGNALSFDGNDYVNIPYDLGDPDAMSLEFWFYVAEGDKNRQQYFMDGRNGGNWWFLQNYNGTGNINFYNRAIVDSSDWTAGQWNHLVLTVDSGASNIYINGIPEATGPGYNPDIGSNMRIGTRYSNSGYFRGRFDEVRVYSRAITAIEAQERYQGVFNSENGLVGLWHFDEGSGAITSDSSNYGNTGAITGASWSEHGPQCGNKYSWQAVAHSMGPDSTFSNITTPEVMPVCAPSKPGLVLSRHCEAGNSVVSLSWSFSINATSYEIYRDATLVETVASSTWTFTDDNDGLGLISGNTYTYWVKAVGATDSTESDHLDIIAVNCIAPSPPENLQLSFSCSGSYPEVYLSWTGTSTADYYEVYRDGSLLAGDITATSTIDSYPSVEVNKDYSYYVIACNAGGCSSPSNEESITTGYCPVSKPSVGAITYCNPEDDPINEIFWTDETSFNTSEYKVHRNTTNSSSTATLIRTIPRSDSFALEFDGVDGNVDCGNSGSLDITDAITIEAWVKAGHKNYQEIISKATGGFAKGWAIYEAGTTDYLRWYIDDGTTQIARTGNKVVFDNQWHHIVMIFDQNVDTAYQYVDAESGGSWDISGVGDVNVADDLVIGVYGSNFFDGTIDEVRVYNRALSPSEVSEHYKGVYDDETELRGLWHFAEGSGSTTVDSSGQGNDGDLSSGVEWVAAPSDIRFHSKILIDDDPALLPSSDYYYWVETIGYIEQPSFSDSASISTYACGVIPPSPTITDLTTDCYGAGSSYNTLSWTGNPPTDVSYNVYRTNPSLSTSTFYTRLSPFEDQGSFSLRLDGDDDYIDCGNDASLQITGNLTIEFWMYDREKTGFPLTKSYNNEYGMEFNTGGRMHFYHGDTANYSAFQCGGIWRDPGDLNQWGHIAIVRDTVDQSVDFYKNGSLFCENVKSTTGWFDPTVSSWTTRIGVGQEGGHPSTNVFNGDLDEVRIYARALTADEISEHYQGIYRNETELRGAWHFDRGGDFPTPDDSGYVNHGIVYGATPISDGALGKAFDFDKADSDYIHCDDGADLGTDSFTYETWIRVLPSSDSAPIIQKMSSIPVGANEGWEGRILVMHSGASQPNKVLFYVTNGWYYDIYRYSSIDVTDGSWHHIIAVCDRTKDTPPDLYIDGQLRNGAAGAGQCSDLAGYDLPGGGDLFLGRRGNYLDGSIDEVRIYSRALDATEASEHFSGIFNDESGLIGLWHLDEGMPSIAFDSSGQGNHGSVFPSGAGADWVNFIPTDPAYDEKIHNEPLENEESYTYQVTAAGVNTESDFSSPWSISTLRCGIWIENLTVTPQCVSGSSQLYLDWDSENSLYWSIYRNRVGEDPEHLIDITETSYADIQVESETTYEYFIQAFSEGESVFSEVASATAPFCTEAPQKPVITVTPECFGYSPRMLIEWPKDLNGYTFSYNIWRATSTYEGCTSTLEFTAIEVGWPPDTYDPVQYFDRWEVEEEETYCYEVEARGSGEDNFTFSDPVASTSLACGSLPPPEPELEINFIHLEVGNCAVSLGWTDVGLDPGLDDNFYEVLRSLDGIDYSFLATTSGNVFYYLDQPVDENTDYYYIVQARNKNGGTYSNSVLAEVGIAPPGSFTLTGEWIGGTTKVRLTWTEAETGVGGDVSYDVLRDDTENFETAPTLICGGISALQCFDDSPTFLEPFYKVVATNNGGSTDSNVINMMHGFPFPIWIEVIPQ